MCPDSTSTDCTLKMWQIRPQDAELSTYLTYDEATHPSAVTEVWLRCVPNNMEILAKRAQVLIFVWNSDRSIRCPTLLVYFPAPLLALARVRVR